MKIAAVNTIYTDTETGARVKVTPHYITIEKRIKGVRHGTTININLIDTVASVTARLVKVAPRLHA